MAAFISEPLLGNQGAVQPPDGFLAGAYAAVRADGDHIDRQRPTLVCRRLACATSPKGAVGQWPPLTKRARDASGAYVTSDHIGGPAHRNDHEDYFYDVRSVAYRCKKFS